MAQELEKRQRQIEYDTQLSVKNLEVVTRQEVLQVGTDLDKKVEAHKEYLENAVNNCHSSLKKQILIDQDVVEKLTERVVALERQLGSRVAKIETSIEPELKKEKSRRKVDYEDLKGWLVDTIDVRLKEEKARIEEENERKYKSQILKQKQEIDNLKRKVKFAKPKENEAPGSVMSTPSRSRFPAGSKENEFLQHLDEVKPRVDEINEANKAEF